MATVPSVKSIAGGLSIDTQKAKQIRAVLASTGGWEGIDDVDQSSYGRRIEVALDEVSTLMGAYDFEVIRGNSHDSFWMDGVLAYVNRGDTYDTTVVYDINEDRFRIMSYGAWVETHGDEYDVQ